MAKGGHPRSGPAPDPTATRHGAKGREWIDLPDRRDAPAPEWPATMKGKATAQEAEKWAEVWRLPQATEWDRLNLVAQVAVYVRTWCRASADDASAAILAHTRALETDLGLNVAGMHSNGWRRRGPGPTNADPKPTAGRQRVSNAGRRSGASDRLAVIEGGGGTSGGDGAS